MRKIHFFLVLALLCAAFSITSAPHVLASGKVLRLGAREYDSFDPQMTGGNAQGTIENALFRGLLRYDEKGNVAPGIALEVPTVANGDISADGKTYTFKLRDDWKWSDGKGVVTAQDFVYSYQRLVDPKTAGDYGAFLNGIVVNAEEVHAGKKPVSDLGVKAVNDHTFEVDLVKPVSYFNAIAAMWIGYVVRKDNVERAGLPKPDSWTDPANGEVVGSGPFRITQWDHNNSYLFERNTNYSGPAAKLDQIKFIVVDPAKGDYPYYQDGSIDVAGVPSDVYKTLDSKPDIKKLVVQYKAACTNALAMNNANPPFDNKKVREAFTYALNRDQREAVIDGGIHVKQLSWLPEGIPGFDAKLGFDFDPAKAKQALADAGYPDGKGLPEVTFSYPNVPEGQRVADWYKEQFKKVLNVDIKLDPMDITTFVNRLWDRKNALPSMYEWGWCADYLHPSDWLQLVFGTASDNNVISFNDPEFDKLSKAADAELNPDKGIEEYKQAQTLLVNDFPVIFFNTSRVTKVVRPNVLNLKPSALDGGIIGGFFWEDIDLAS